MSAPADAQSVMSLRTDASKAAFLESLAACGNISQAAKLAGIDRRTHYYWAVDKAYCEAVANAMEIATDALVEEARRRAIEGVAEPVFQAGERMTDPDGKPAVIRRYSDTLLQFLLRGDRPEKYRDKTLNVTGKVSLETPAQITINMLTMSGDELREAMLQRQEGIRQGIITTTNDPDAARKQIGGVA